MLIFVARAVVYVRADWFHDKKVYNKSWRASSVRSKCFDSVSERKVREEESEREAYKQTGKQRPLGYQHIMTTARFRNARTCARQKKWPYRTLDRLLGRLTLKNRSNHVTRNANSGTEMYNVLSVGKSRITKNVDQDYAQVILQKY